MSRHNVSNLVELNAKLESLLANNPPDSRTLWGVSLPDCLSAQYLSDSLEAEYLPATSALDRSDRISGLLGSEHQCIVYGAPQIIDLGFLAALCGTVRQGGLIVLVLDRDLPHFFKSNLTKTSALYHGANSKFVTKDDQHNSHLFPSPSNQRFYRLLHQYSLSFPDTVRLFDEQLNPLSTSPDDIEQSLAPASQHGISTSRTPAEEQTQNIRLALRFLQQNKTAYVSITGKRGRGKSALMAQIAESLLARQSSFAVTASHPSALNSFFKHCGGAENRFISLEKALRHSATETLFIDEAANIPVNTIEKLAHKYPRLVTCTTIEGYENSGVAFQIRLAKKLHAHYQNVLNIEPRKVWRWQSPDVLEQFIDRLTLNESISDNNTRQETHPAHITDNCLMDQRVYIQEIKQNALANDEKLLHAVFSLFKKTHYQTNLKDLQHLLDGEKVRLWVARFISTDEVIAALLAGEEGPIEKGLHEAIVSKKRRLPHQLLPQLLAQTGNSYEALDFRYLRVIRICVQPQWRRKKCATKLVQTVETQLLSDRSITNGCHAIGASFAGDEMAKAFWCSNGYTEFHQGYRLNPRTGTQATAVLKTRLKQIDNVLKRAASINNENLHYLKHSKNPPSQITSYSSTDYNDKLLLERFARNQRSANDTYAALSRLAHQSMIDLTKQSDMSQKSFEKSLRYQVQKYLELSIESKR